MIDVSIIIPVYNKASYLDECLNCILNQTKKEIEIICVDDCSTDYSVEIIRKFSCFDERVILIRNQRNMGAGEARNIGLKQAIGKYVIFLDADDLFDPKMIEVLFDECEKNEVDVLHCDVFFFDQTTHNKYLVSSSDSYMNSIKERVVSGDIIYDKVMYMIVPPYANMIRRQFIVENNILFQNISNNNDAYFAKLCYVLSRRIKKFDYAFVRARKNIKNQLSSDFKSYAHNYSLARKAIANSLIKKGIYRSIYKSLNTYWATGFINYIYDLNSEDRREVLPVVKADIEDMIDDRNEEFEFDNLYQKEYLLDLLKVVAAEEIINPYDYCLKYEFKKRNKWFEFLVEHDTKVVVWGYSKYGRNIESALEKNGFPVAFSVDINYEKFGHVGICAPEMIRNGIYMIVTANAHIYNGIVKDVKSINEKCIVFDMMSFFTYDIPFDNCIT